jgi:hypothetical protein
MAAVFLLCIPAPRLPKIIGGVHDTWTYFGAHAFYMDHALHQGEFPLWNPLILCGQPEAAQPMHALFSPSNLVRSALVSKPTPYKSHLSWYWMLAAHVLFAGVCTFLLARSLALSRAAALVAAFAFILNAGLVQRVFETWISTLSVSLFPFLLWLTLKMLRAKRVRAKLQWAVAAGLVLGFSLLSGSPPVVGIFAVAMGALVVLHHLPRLRKLHPLRRILGDGFALGLAGSIGGLLSLVMLLPALELIRLSGRAKDAGLAFRAAYESPFTWDVFERLTVYAAPMALPELMAAGLCIWVLAFAALFHKRKRTLLLVGGLLYVLLDCSLGPPMPIMSLYNELAPFKTSTTKRLMVLTCLPLGLLAGMGLDALIRVRRGNLAFTVLYALVCAALFVPLILMLRSGSFLHVSIITALAPAALLLCALIARHAPTPKVLALLAPLLILVEVTAWNREFLPFALSRFKEYELTHGKSLEPIKKEARFSLLNRRTTARVSNAGLYDLRAAFNGYDPLLLLATRQALCAPDLESEYRRFVYKEGVTRDNHRGNLILKRPFWLVPSCILGSLPAKDKLFPPTQVAYVEPQDPPPVPILDEAPVGSSLATPQLFAPLNATAHAFTRDSTTSDRYSMRLPESKFPLRHGALVLRLISTAYGNLYTSFESSQEIEYGFTHTIAPTLQAPVFLEIPLPALEEAAIQFRFDRTPGDNGTIQILDANIIEDGADEDALIRIDSYGANAVALSVGPLPEQRLLVHIDAYYPGWYVYVNDEEQDLLRVNDVFKGVALPAGEHTVRFEFRPRPVFLGATISGMTAVCCVLFLLVNGVGLRRRKG